MSRTVHDAAREAADAVHHATRSIEPRPIEVSARQRPTSTILACSALIVAVAIIGLATASIRRDQPAAGEEQADPPSPVADPSGRSTELSAAPQAVLAGFPMPDPSAPEFPADMEPFGMSMRKMTDQRPPGELLRVFGDAISNADGARLLVSELLDPPEHLGDSVVNQRPASLYRSNDDPGRWRLDMEAADGSTWVLDARGLSAVDPIELGATLTPLSGRPGAVVDPHLLPAGWTELASGVWSESVFVSEQSLAHESLIGWFASPNGASVTYRVFREDHSAIAMSQLIYEGERDIEVNGEPGFTASVNDGSFPRVTNNVARWTMGMFTVALTAIGPVSNDQLLAIARSFRFADPAVPADATLLAGLSVEPPSTMLTASPRGGTPPTTVGQAPPSSLGATTGDVAPGFSAPLTPTRVLVVNAARIPALAGSLASRLETAGYDALPPGNAAADEASREAPTTVRFRPGFEAVAAQLATELGVVTAPLNEDQVWGDATIWDVDRYRDLTVDDVDIVVVLHRDFAAVRER